MCGTTNGIISGNFMEFQSTPKLTYGHTRSWRKNQLKLAEVHNCWKRRFYSIAENCNYDYKKLMHLHKHNDSPYCGNCKVFIDLRKDVPRKMTRWSKIVHI